MTLGVVASVFAGLGLCVVITYQFMGIAKLCDEYLCPALDKLCEQWRLPHSIAGATLVAFGSSAPELIISAGGALSDQTELSIPTLLTSALIAFGLIPPVVILVVGDIKLRRARARRRSPPLSPPPLSPRGARGLNAARAPLSRSRSRSLLAPSVAAVIRDACFY